jgi:hypothetical protein
MHADHTKFFSIPSEHDAELGFANTHGVRQHGIEYRLKVGRRA